MPLKDKVALVTGASRGVGRGIAIQLGAAGATVYVTGRKHHGEQDESLPTLEDTAKEVTRRGGEGIAVYCDHSNPEEVRRLFERIQREHNGKLDILVNNAYSAADFILRGPSKKFWEMDPLVWDDVNNVGLRNHYICSVYAARLMVERRAGLIVNVSSIGGLKYLFNVPYGVGKSAIDRMTADCALELKEHNVACVSLWPSAVRTELVTKYANEGVANEEIKLVLRMCENGESPEYVGKCVVHLDEDIHLMQKTGRVLVTEDLGDEFGFTDIDGKRPVNIRSLKFLMSWLNWTNTASWTPGWIKIPNWLINMSGSKW